MVFVAKMIGMFYAVVALLVLVYLLNKNALSKKIRYFFLVASSLMGFIFFAPMIPNQFQSLIVGKGSNVAIVGVLLFIALTFVFGRIFCGYICPIGAVQELAYCMQTKKLKITKKTTVYAIHILFFGAFLISGLIFSIAILRYLGFYDFFHMNTVSPFFYVFLSILIVSIFIYRPFCRLFCPYGLILSIVSAKSVFKLQRNENCTDCSRCERICPTNEIKSDSKLECYLCNRCREVCRVDAIDYSK